MQISKREITKHRNSYIPVESSDVITEDVMLAVTFDEKDEVKRLGATWNPDPSGKGGYWSIQTNRLEKNCTLESVSPGFTILDYLNSNGMVYKQIGSIRSELTTNLTTPDASHPLRRDGHRVQFDSFTLSEGNTDGISVNVIKFIDLSGAVDAKWMLLESGRELWDSLIAGGYNHTTPHKTESV
jgi:hypothetical protein